jgi:hypothetical protein
MDSERKTIPPFLYFFLISFLTTLVFIMVGIIAVAPFSLKSTATIVIILSVFLLYKSGIVGLVAWFTERKSNNKEFLVKFIGRYQGGFFGIIIGGFLGAKILDLLGQTNFLGFIAGALGLYFAGRWIGPKVSYNIAGLLEKVAPIRVYQEQEIVIKAMPAKTASQFVFIIALPLAFVIIGLLLSYFEVPIGYMIEYLPIARIIVILLSIFVIIYPWLMKKRWRMKYKSSTSSPDSMVFWLGIPLSVVPAVYGFILFVGVGASFLELCCFALASTIAGIIWSLNEHSLKERKLPSD